MPAPLPDPPPSSGFVIEQILRAREAWHKAVSPTYRDLVDAEPVGEDMLPPSPL